MKHLMIIFSALAIVGLYSCKEDDGSIGNSRQPDTEGLLIDGGQISDVKLYCLEKGRTYYDDENLQEYYAKTKTVKDYSDIELDIKVDRNRYTYRSQDASEMSAISELEQEYSKKKTAFIVDDMEKYNATKRDALGYWPEFFSAYVKGEVIITCDKTLYGEEPGTNLCKYISLISPEATQCVPVGVENPTLQYSYGDQLPDVLSEYIADGAWLRPDYWLEFKNQPTEKYESITLYLTMPLLIEYSHDYAVSLFKGDNTGVKFEEQVFTAECSINFD